MTLSATQNQAITAQLAIDLSTVSNDRLIELCLLYRAEPNALPSFPVALDNEIARRFTDSELNSNGVMFSVLQNFANQFQSPIPYAHKKMLEMAATVNRDIWFTNNEAFFISSLNNDDVMAWMVEQSDILEKCINNDIALALIAQSTIASTHILSHATASVIWKNRNNLFDIWANYSQGMAVLCQSSDLATWMSNSSVAMQAVADSSIAMQEVANSSIAMQAVINNSVAMPTIINNAVAMQAVADSSVAMQEVANNSVAMQLVVNSSVAMQLVVNSPVSMQEIANSSVAVELICNKTQSLNQICSSSGCLSVLVGSTHFKEFMVNNNQIFQSVKNVIFDTVTSSWTKLMSGQSYPGYTINQLSSSNSMGFVFLYLGCYALGQYGPQGVNGVKHYNDLYAGQGNRILGDGLPSVVKPFHAITFNNFSIYAVSGAHHRAVAELWIPPNS